MYKTFVCIIILDQSDFVLCYGYAEDMRYLVLRWKVVRMTVAVWLVIMLFSCEYYRFSCSLICLNNFSIDCLHWHAAFFTPFVATILKQTLTK